MKGPWTEEELIQALSIARSGQFAAPSGGEAGGKTEKPTTVDRGGSLYRDLAGDPVAGLEE